MKFTFNQGWLKIVIVAICLLLGSCQNSSLQLNEMILSAQPIKVISGQTIEVMIPQQDNHTHRVRIIGIDVPKLEDASWQEKAKTRLQELIKDIPNSSDLNLILELESPELDSYDRILAHVWQDNLLISEQLAQEGYVVANTKYPHKYSDRIFHGQEYARILGYGIWE